MTTRLVGLAALVAVIGCTRTQTRRDPLRRQALPAIPPTSLPDAAPVSPELAFERPTPPTPPPLPVASAPPARAAVRAQEPTPAEPLSNPATRAEPVRGEVAAAVPVSRAAEEPGRSAVLDAAPIPLPEPPPAPTVPIRAAVPPAPADSAASADPTPAPPPPAATPSPADRAKELIEAAKQRYAGVTDYECRLIKREVVNGKAIPQDEILYRFRKTPLSVSMKILSEAGQGREVIFVKGRDDKAMHVLTGKGDSRLVGVGYKTTVDPDGRDAASKSRYRIYQAGFGRTLQGLDLALQRGFEVQAVGLVQRPEWPYPLECVTVRATGPGDPMLPPGCKRSIFLDPNPESPTYHLPVLTEMRDPAGQEIEYYSFDRFKLPAGLTDADFDPARMGKRR